jgi:hypothetical protein
MVSVQCMAIAVAIQTTWGSLDDNLRAFVPHRFVAFGTVFFLVTGIIGRLLKQKPPEKS